MSDPESTKRENDFFNSRIQFVPFNPLLRILFVVSDRAECGFQKGYLMHHYPFHIGDYLIKTAHLSVEEDCAYRRLLDLYYETEAPIQNETQTVSKRIRMGSQSDIVGLILQEFFTLQDDNCWHQSHCDEVIAAYHAKCEHNREAGKLGGRPKKNIKTQTVSKRLANDNRSITVSNPNQEPITNNQEPRIKEKPMRENALTALVEMGVDRQCAEDWIAVRKAKRAPLTKTVLADLEREAGKAGLTVSQAVEICAKKSWQGFNASWSWQDVFPGQNKRIPKQDNFSERDYGTGGAL